MPEENVGSLQKSKGWRDAVKKIPGVRRINDLGVVIENWWFDLYHNVDTSPQLSKQKQKGWLEDKINFYYVPTRPKWVRRSLRNLPPKVRQEYTFVDFGGGKGRVLLMAARFGFKQLYGIELRKELHDRARWNFQQYKKADRCRLESLNMDAAEYELPNSNLVLFFFNPFSSDVMQKVICNLDISLARNFRDVWVVLHDSVCSHLADESPHLRLEIVRYGYRIYRSAPH